MSIFKAVKILIDLYVNNCWKLADYFIKADNIVQHQHCPIDEKENTKDYTCIRNFDGLCLYIGTKELDVLYDNQSFYNKKYELINITALRRFSEKRQVIGQVYNETSPATVKIKAIETIRYDNTVMYLVYNFDLDYNDPLYEDLLNYKNIEGKF